MSSLPKETPFPFFSGTSFFGAPCFLFFFFLALQRLARLKCNLGAKLQAYLGVIILQPHACAQRFTFAGQGQMLDGQVLGASGRIEPIWETPSKERAAGPNEAQPRPHPHALRAVLGCCSLATTNGGINLSQPKSMCLQLEQL